MEGKDNIKIEDKDLINIKIVNNLLEGIIKRTDYKVNDIFFTEWDYISIKKDWDVIITKQKLSREEIVAFVELLLKQKNKTIREFYENKDIDISYTFKWEFYEECNFRINIFYNLWRISIVFRVLQNEIPTLESLNIPLEFIQPLLKATEWLILFVWSTWSWKTTSIAAFINYLNETRKKHILTLEDPVEYKFKNKNCLISQREIGTDTISYWTWMKAALRESPNIVMIWEIRDFETLNAALKMAETWHLVISTLHTKWCVSTINRMLQLSENVSWMNNVIASALKWVIFQKLIRKKEGWRILALETMYNNHKISQAINDWTIWQINSVIETSRDEWMILFKKYLEEKVIPLNVVSWEEIILANNNR